MIDEFRPRTLTEVAKMMGSDPFEVIRLLTAARSVPESLTFTEEQVQRVRQAMGKR